MKNPDVILTGAPRSGTTLTCHLLNKLPDVIALHEPMNVSGFSLFQDHEEVCDEIELFFRRTRKTLMENGTAISKHVDGRVPDNPVDDAHRVLSAESPDPIPRGFTPEKSTRSTLRESRCSKGPIRFPNPSTARLSLCIKHNAAFTAVLERLHARLPCHAVIRNPLSVLASWNSVKFPVREGRAPAAERLDPTLALELARKEERFERQLYILSWFFEKYKTILPPENILRYEEIVASGGGVLKGIASQAETLNERLENKNNNDIYNKELMHEMGRQLLQTEGAFWEFYSKESVEGLMNDASPVRPAGMKKGREKTAAFSGSDASASDLPGAKTGRRPRGRGPEPKISDIRTLCIMLGPYRSLTTLTAGILFLHPACQVLNHAAIRILPEESLNFTRDYTETKYENFLRSAIRFSEGGRRGFYGGSITLSHAFNHRVLRQTFRDRFGDSLVKSPIHSLVWKDSMKVANFIRKNQVDPGEILARNKRVRFLTPIRNPLDCAASNYAQGMGGHFHGLKNHSRRGVLDHVLREISWFLDLQKKHPGGFFHFFENEFDREMLISLAAFLGLDPGNRWIEDGLKCYRLRAPYLHAPGFIRRYEHSIKDHFHGRPPVMEKLLGFASRARLVNRNARPHPAPGVSTRETQNGEGAVLVGESGGKRVALNETGRIIWSLCDGSRDRQGILRGLAACFAGGEEDGLARDLDGFINNLVGQGFLRLFPTRGKARGVERGAHRGA
ncbi:MAG: PqqD family peptide modification chaperone [Desulfobacterales bacterium]|nr:PqqD family peptide modification chaperone [Desulfobacterales bacterium]